MRRKCIRKWSVSQSCETSDQNSEGFPRKYSTGLRAFVTLDWKEFFQVWMNWIRYNRIFSPEPTWIYLILNFFEFLGCFVKFRVNATATWEVYKPYSLLQVFLSLWKFIRFKRLENADFIPKLAAILHARCPDLCAQYWTLTACLCIVVWLFNTTLHCSVATATTTWCMYWLIDWSVEMLHTEIRLGALFPCCSAFPYPFHSIPLTDSNSNSSSNEQHLFYGTLSSPKFNLKRKYKSHFTISQTSLCLRPPTGIYGPKQQYFRAFSC